MPPVAHALPAPWIDSIPEPLISWRSGGLLSLADLQVLRDGTQPDPIVWAPYFVQQYLTAQQQARIIWRDPVAVDMPADGRQVRDAAIAAYQHPSASMAELFPVYTTVGGQRAYSLLIVEPGGWIYHWVPGSGSDLNARAFDLADYRGTLAARLANRFHLHKAPEVAVGDSFYFLLYAVEKVCDARGSLSPAHLLSPTPRYLQTFRKRLLDRLEQQLSPRRIAPRIRRLPFVRLLEDLGARYPEHGAEILQVFQLALRCDDQAGLPRRARSLDAYRTAEADLKRSRDELYQALLRLLEHQLPFLLPASRTLGLVQTAPAFWRRGEIEWTHKVRGEKVLMDRWAHMEWQVLRLIHLRLDALEALPSPTAGEQAELKTLVYALWRIEVHLFLYDKNAYTTLTRATEPLRTDLRAALAPLLNQLASRPADYWASLYQRDDYRRLDADQQAHIQGQAQDLVVFFEEKLFAATAQTAADLRCPLPNCGFQAKDGAELELHVYDKHGDPLEDLLLHATGNNWNKVKDIFHRGKVAQVVHAANTRTIVAKLRFDKNGDLTQDARAAIMASLLYYRGGLTTTLLDNIIRQVFNPLDRTDKDIVEAATEGLLPNPVPATAHWIYFNAAGSTAPTSDIDVNLKGHYTQQVAMLFNQAFRRRFKGMESGFVLDVNVYAQDYMPDPGLRLLRPNDPGDQLDARSLANQERSSHVYAFWSLLKIRRYWAASPNAATTPGLNRWQDFVQQVKTRIETFPLGAQRRRQETAQFWERMALAAAQRWTDIEAQLDTQRQTLRLGAEAQKDPHNVQIRVENEVYQAALTRAIQIREVKDGLRKPDAQALAALYAGARYDPGPDGRADPDHLLVLLNDQLCRCDVAAQEGAHSRSYLRHVVQNLQLRQGVNVSLGDYLNSFNEQIGDMLKEIAHVFHGPPTGDPAQIEEAGTLAAKYMLRTVYACEDLLERIRHEALVESIPLLHKLALAEEPVSNQPLPPGTDPQWLTRIRRLHGDAATRIDEVRQRLVAIRAAGLAFLAKKKAGGQTQGGGSNNPVFTTNFIREHEHIFIELAVAVNGLVLALLEVPASVKALYGLGGPQLQPGNQARMLFDQVVAQVERVGDLQRQQTQVSRKPPRLDSGSIDYSRAHLVLPAQVRDLPGCWERLYDLSRQPAYGQMKKTVDDFALDQWFAGYTWERHGLPASPDDYFYPEFAALLNRFIEHPTWYQDHKAAFDTLINQRADSPQTRWIRSQDLVNKPEHAPLLHRLLLESMLPDWLPHLASLYKDPAQLARRILAARTSPTIQPILA